MSHIDENKRQGSVKAKHCRMNKRVLRRIGFVIATGLLICFLSTAIFMGIFLIYVKTTVIPTSTIDADDYTMNFSSIIYYQDEETGEWMPYQSVHGEENRIWVDFNDVPEALWQAVVAIEDHRFFDHQGVDWKRTIGATLNMFIGTQDTYGGSTITQQVIKNITKDNSATVNRKVREIFRALEFEKNYTKQQILELYLNTIYLGKGCYGVQTASKYYFGKDVSELSVAECASLIAITNNPSMYGPMSEVSITREDGTTITPREANKKRQEIILDRMAGKYGTGLSYLSEEEAEAAKGESLCFTDGTVSAEDLVAATNGESSINSWFVDQVIMDVSADLAEMLGISETEARSKLFNSGYNIYTTLKPDIQRIAESVYNDRGNINNLTSASGQPLRSGITIIDPHTGNIVALVGDLGKKEGNLIWNYATDKRQVGSSIKPLTVYAPALDAGKITMASSFDDYPVGLLNDRPWPKNSVPGYRGWTTLKTAVANSVNTISVRVLKELGVAESYSYATEKLKLSLAPEDMAESPLALGGLTYGLNTVEMAAAYATFANGGIYCSPRTYIKVTDSEGNVVLENEGEQHVAMDESTAYFMNTLLKGVVSYGTGRSASFPGMTIAGKTGTSDDNFTKYFVGYTPYYVAAVWTGYKENEQVRYSGNPAITLWKKVMQPIHAELPNIDFETPACDMDTVEVCMDSGLLPTEACYADPRGSRVQKVTVVSGTQPTEECSLHVIKDFCVDGKAPAGPFCPETSLEKRVYLNWVREDYGENISADDDAYLVGSNEETVELQNSCSVHSTLNQNNQNNYDEEPDIHDFSDQELNEENQRQEHELDGRTTKIIQ